MSEVLPKGSPFRHQKTSGKPSTKARYIHTVGPRYGDGAKELAQRALELMQAGTFDPVADDLLFKQSWKMDDVARLLGLSLGQLRLWMLTGIENGKEIRPPKRDVRGVDRITGYELMMAQERLAT